NTGTLLNLNASSGTAQITQNLLVTNSSTGAFANGGVRFNFTGAHTNNGFQVNDVTSSGTAVNILTTAINTGKALSITDSGTAITTAGANTGSLLNIQSGVDTAFTGNLAALNFTGTVVGNTGTILNLNSSAGTAQ